MVYNDYLKEKHSDIVKMLSKKSWISSYQIFLQSIKEKSSRVQERELQTSSDTITIGAALQILDTNSRLVEKYYAISSINQINDLEPPKSTQPTLPITEFTELKQPHASSVPGDYANSVDMKNDPDDIILQNALNASTEYEIPFSHEAHVSIENRLISNSNQTTLNATTLKTNYNVFTFFDFHNVSYNISRHTAGRTLDLDVKSKIVEIVQSTILKIKNSPKELPENPAVLFHPDVLGELLTNYFTSTSLQSKLNQQLWADNIQLYDDPLRSKGYDSYLFDDEGSLTHPLHLISDGYVEDYLKDYKSTGWKVGGNGFRTQWYQPNIRSYQFDLSPTASNLVLKGGTGKGEYFPERPGYVLVVRQGYSYPGVGSDDAEFLLHVSEAEIWKDGDPIGPISNLTVKGNLDQILKDGHLSSDENISVNQSVPGTVYAGWLAIPPATVSLR